MEEHVPIDDIRCVEKWTVQKGPNFRFIRENDRSLYGRIEAGARFWADAFREDDRVELKPRH